MVFREGGMQDETAEHGSMRELNHRFLELLAGDAPFGARLQELTREQRAAAADCPYALFDLRLHDAAHWQLRLSPALGPRVADRPEVSAELADFMRLALFYAWHVAASGSLFAKLLLGMHEGTGRAFTRITVDRLPELALAESRELRARWLQCEGFWAALVGAAARQDAKRLRRVQLYGIQLAAAAQLPLQPVPHEV
jgi:hypothetical protein